MSAIDRLEGVDTFPKLLLLDEPMAGMNAEEKEDMARFVVDVNEERGTTIIMIEHDMGVVMDLSNRVTVLDFGEKIADGLPDDVRRLPEVQRAYLGEHHGTFDHRVLAQAGGEPEERDG